MPPDRTYRCRCFRWLPPDACGTGTVFGLTWRTCCRTCCRPATRLPLPIQRECIGAGVEGVRAIDPRERGERVGPRGAGTEDVLDGDSSREEGVRDQAPVTAPGHRLGAHHRDRLRPVETVSKLEQPLEPGPELVALHVVRVAPEA